MLMSIASGNGGWMGAAARYGVAIVLSLVLTAFVIGRVDAALTDIKTVVGTNGGKMDVAQISMGSFAAEYRQSQREMLKLLRQTCENTATTDIQRQGCR